VLLDIDSSPWRRWSPILFDVTIAVFLIHVEIALLHAFFPTAMDAGETVPRVMRFFDWLATPYLLRLWWWGQVAAGLILLLPVRAAIGLAGWHRIAFFPIAMIFPVVAHFDWLERLP
jgi:hypothetical protein